MISTTGRSGFGNALADTPGGASGPMLSARDGGEKAIRRATDKKEKVRDIMVSAPGRPLWPTEDGGQGAGMLWRSRRRREATHEDCPTPWRPHPPAASAPP